MNKYFIKQFLLKSSLYSDYLKIEKTLYLDLAIDDFEQDVLPNSTNLLPVKVAKDLQEYYLKKCPHLYKECRKLVLSRSARITRLKKRVTKMITSGNCIFLTFTFNDCINTTTAQTRRGYIKEFCNSLQCPYVGNIDFGSKGGREHYHVLVQTDFVDYTRFAVHGNLDGTRVRLDANETDHTKISRYIAKLTNHAIKETTRNSYIIYSRKYK